MQMNIEMPKNFEDEIQTAIYKAVTKILDQKKVSDKYPEYMDIGTAAEYLGVSRGTFTQKVLKTSNMPITVIAERVTRIKKSDLDKYMAEKAI